MVSSSVFFFIADICGPTQPGSFLLLRIGPVSEHTDVSIPSRGAVSARMFNVSTLIQTPLFSSYLSAPDVALGVKTDL